MVRNKVLLGNIVYHIVRFEVSGSRLASKVGQSDTI